jgi:hypothetical protein
VKNQSRDTTEGIIDLGDTVDINRDGIMKTKAEMEEVWRRYKRNQWACTWAGGGILIFAIITSLIGNIYIDKNFSIWVESVLKKYFLILFLILFVFFFFFQKSKFYWKYFESLRIPLLNVAMPYKKAEEDIINGIQQEKIKWVIRGVEHLEDLDEYLSEMPEYQELLEKGRKFLRQNNIPLNAEKDK